MDFSIQHHKKKGGGFKDVKSLLDKYVVEENVYVTREWQSYGLDLASELDDFEHRALFIKLAKSWDRSILEEARSYVKDAMVDNKARLFMWKIKEIKESRKEKEKLKNEAMAMGEQLGLI